MRPPQPPGEEYSHLAKDGLISSVLGSAAMSARLLLEDDPKPWKVILAKGFAAGIVAVFVGLASKEHIQSLPLWLAVVGLSGFAAPEVAAGAVKYVKNWIDSKVGAVTPKKNGKRAKRK